MALIRENGGLDIRFYARHPEKAHNLGLGGTACFWRILRKKIHQDP